MRLEPIPVFEVEVEDEEALWWDAHAEELIDRFIAAKKLGGALSGASEMITIRIPAE